MKNIYLFSVTGLSLVFTIVIIEGIALYLLLPLLVRNTSEEPFEKSKQLDIDTRPGTRCFAKTNMLVKVRGGYKIIIEGINEFEEGGAELSEDLKRELDSISEKFFRDYRNIVEIRGFTDSDVKDSINGDHNLLSYYRAQNASNYLITQNEKTGIDSKRIRVTSCGANESLTFPSDQNQNYKNRRIEVIVSEELIRVSQ